MKTDTYIVSVSDPDHPGNRYNPIKNYSFRSEREAENFADNLKEKADRTNREAGYRKVQVFMWKYEPLTV